MRPESRMLLQDMLDAAQAIEQFVSQKHLADFKSDELLRSGIYYKFAIIGEALSKLSKQDEALSDQIDEAPRIVGFRNQIIHGYALIDDEITWRIVRQKLPVLLRQLRTLLDQ